MHETAEERERRLRQIGGGSEIWNDADYLMSQWIIQNPCTPEEVCNFFTHGEIVLTSSQRCTLGDNPLIKYNEYKFNF